MKVTGLHGLFILITMSMTRWPSSGSKGYTVGMPNATCFFFKYPYLELYTQTCTCVPSVLVHTHTHTLTHTRTRTCSLSLLACVPTSTTYRPDPALELFLAPVYFPFPLLFVIVLTWALDWGQGETTSGKDSSQRMFMTLAHQPWKEMCVCTGGGGLNESFHRGQAEET